MRSFRLEKYQEIPQVNTTFTQTACLNPILTVSGCGTCCTNGGTTLNLGVSQVATFAPNIPVSSVLTLQFKIQWPASANMSLRTVTYSTANGQTPIPVANFFKGDEYAFVTISKDIAPINLAVQFGVAGAVLSDISYSITSGTYLVNDKMKDLLPEIICNQEDKTGKYFYTSTTSTCSLTELNGNLVITPTSGNQESLARWYNGLEVGKTYTFVARVPLGTHFGQGRPVIRVTDFNGRGITLLANTGLMPYNNGNHTVAQASRHPDGNEWVFWLRFPATTTSVKLEYLGAIQGVNEGQTLTSLQLLQTLPEAEYGGSSNYRYGFNGKEKENTLYNSSNAYDFGARLYDGRIGRWFGIDALRQEYPCISPFAFAANNPYFYVDSDGKKIFIHYIDRKGKNLYYEYGSSKKVPNNLFVKNTIMALDDIKNTGKGKSPEIMLTQIEKSKVKNLHIIEEKVGVDKMHTDIDFKDANGNLLPKNQLNSTVSFSPPLNQYSSDNATINFMPNSSLADPNPPYNSISPSTALVHEIAHAWGAFFTPYQHIKRSATPNASYDNDEEVFATDQEKVMAASKNEWLRTNHKIANVITTSSPVKNK